MIVPVPDEPGDRNAIQSPVFHTARGCRVPGGGRLPERCPAEGGRGFPQRGGYGQPPGRGPGTSSRGTRQAALAPADAAAGRGPAGQRHLSFTVVWPRQVIAAAGKFDRREVLRRPVRTPAPART